MAGVAVGPGAPKAMNYLVFSTKVLYVVNKQSDCATVVMNSVPFMFKRVFSSNTLLNTYEESEKKYFPFRAILKYFICTGFMYFLC